MRWANFRLVTNSEPAPDLWILEILPDNLAFDLNDEGPRHSALIRRPDFAFVVLSFLLRTTDGALDPLAGLNQAKQPARGVGANLQW
jgi:hypothetical protein